MKLFSWVQNKLNGKQAASKTDISAHNKGKVLQQGAEKEDQCSDWPKGFLSIGTLGNKDVKDQSKEHTNSISSPLSQDHSPKLTQEEVQQLQKELSALVLNDQGELGSPRSKEIYADGNIGNNALGKKSLSLLLKKMFVCGAAPTLRSMPSFKDPILSPRQTTMEKILRAILNKKIYPQSPRPTVTRKKYLRNRRDTPSSNARDDESDDGADSEDGSDDDGKWVKTDNDYIVLEI